jgi:penicillin amidase
MGGTMPGVSGVIQGRTSDLAWGVTYAFMDSVDSWIEECQEGKYRRGDEWLPFSIRREIIRRKNHPAVELFFYDSPHGVLEGNPLIPGFYLSTRWACLEETSASSLEALSGIMEARSVEEGRSLLGRLNNSAWNWVLADRAGNIGYQMSGKMPRRREGISGIVPLPGWDPANDWHGFADPAELPRSINPPEGFIVTANNDLNALGKVHPINLPMAPYRAERIQDLLAKPDQLNVEAMTKLQFDLYSSRRAIMALLQPLLQSLEKAFPVLFTAHSLGVITTPSRLGPSFERPIALSCEVFGCGG